MFRSVEPKLETRWPFSASPMDSPTSSLIEFLPWIPGKGNESFSSLASILGEAGLSQCMQTSNSTAELERLCSFNEGFFTNSEVSYNIQHGLSSPPDTRISGNKRRIQQSMSSIPVIDVKDNETKIREAKRRKITSGSMENMQNLYPDDRLTKMPARRSQKLGDKITALQQLVSPFGKTDTASVLHEASLHIKDLHEQIQTLTTRSLRLKSSPKLQGYGSDKFGLRRAGLCLVPMSSPIIIDLTNETPID